MESRSKSFKYFIVGAGALPIGLLYGWLCVFGHGVPVLVFWVFVIVALFCGHFANRFVQKIMEKK